MFVDLRRLENDARALPTYKILKLRQHICTFTEADIFVLLQYGIGHSTRHRNFPATCDVIIGNNTLCTKHTGQTSHLVIKIAVTLTVLCFQVKTLKFNLYSVQGCILRVLLTQPALRYFFTAKFTISSNADARV
jgi:hypothetical protein